MRTCRSIHIDFKYVVVFRNLKGHSGAHYKSDQQHIISNLCALCWPQCHGLVWTAGMTCTMYPGDTDHSAPSLLMDGWMANRTQPAENNMNGWMANWTQPAENNMVLDEWQIGHNLQKTTWIVLDEWQIGHNLQKTTWIVLDEWQIGHNLQKTTWMVLDEWQIGHHLSKTTWMDEWQIGHNNNMQKKHGWYWMNGKLDTTCRKQHRWMNDKSDTTCRKQHGWTNGKSDITLTCRKQHGWYWMNGKSDTTCRKQHGWMNGNQTQRAENNMDGIGLMANRTQPVENNRDGWLANRT